jgi:16S rRNA (cytosine967-C5)-methyltransferase
MSKPAHSRPLSHDIAQAAREIAALFDTTNTVSQATPSAAVRDLMYRGLRHWGLAQVRAKRLATKPPTTEIVALLAIAWAGLREQLRPDHVLVDEAVGAAKILSQQTIRGPVSAHAKVAGFVNALLRKTLADPGAAARDLEDPIAKWNAPLWWIHKIQADYGDRASSVLDALACRSPLTIRLSPMALAAKDYIAQLPAHGLSGYQVGPQAVVLQPAVPVHQIPGFSDGVVSVQDASAQRVTELFEDVNALQILDACAAPGGKTIALAQHCQATIWAVDQSKGRLGRLNHDLPRVEKTLKGRVKTVCADILDPDRWVAAGLPEQFDAIVLDAPCSASGVTRRHPEIAWRRSPKAIADVVDIQRRMLDILWRRLKPGGELAFVTCSVFFEEGEGQQRAFLDRTPDARLMPSPGRHLPVASPEDGQDQDGFFFAKFKKITGTDETTFSHSDAVSDNCQSVQSRQ